MTPFARSCGSSTTPRGSRTTPYVMCAWSRTFCQYAMGREANTSSRIAVSAAEFAASFAGSAKRASDSRSGLPMPVASAFNLDGSAISTNQRSSELR